MKSVWGRGLSTSGRMWHLTRALALTALMAASGRGEVFHSKESALRLAFPQADSIEKVDVFLSSDEKAEVERVSRVELSTRMVTMYVGRETGVIVGYAFIETHVVRTLPETVLIVLDPGGNTTGVHLLAFHEPPEYAASPRWLGQFETKPLDDELSLRGEIAGITGATLTANAITAGVRKILAVYKVKVASDAPETAPPPTSGGSDRDPANGSADAGINHPER
jgi:hypothetical protein